MGMPLVSRVDFDRAWLQDLTIDGFTVPTTTDDALARWHNNDRLHGYLHDVPPAGSEATFYAAPRTDQTLVGIQ